MRVRHAWPWDASRLPATFGIRGRVGLLIAVMLSMVLMVDVAAAQSRSSDEVERELRERERETEQIGSELSQVQDQLNQAIDELAAIALSLESAEQDLDVARSQVALAEVALAEAQDERARAARQHEGAVEMLELTEQQLADAEHKLATQLVESFKYGSAGAQHGAMMLEILRRAEDPNSFSVGMRQLQTVIDDQDATVNRIFALREEREGLAEAAALARREANQAAADADQALLAVEELEEQAEQLTAEIAADKQRQQQMIDQLQQSESELAGTLQRVSARSDRLRAEFREARQREAAERAAARASQEGDGGRFPGAAGGPPLDGMICPVQGSPNFINDWGFVRSGGRWHQGNDLFAPRGTPVVAVHNATVVSMNPPSSPTALGGITVTYVTGDGSRWYNAHLDTIADGIQPGVSIARGQMIGTVGTTGNARGTPPHLHLGRRYGGAPVNPFPTIRPVCP